MKTQLRSLIKSFEQQKYQNSISSKEFGTTYTPRRIVDYICEKAFTYYLGTYFRSEEYDYSRFNLENLKALFSEHPQIKQQMAQDLKSIKVLDPSCGSGRFLISIAEYLLKLFENVYPTKKIQTLKKNIVEHHIYGIDIEKKACIISKLRLTLWLKSEEDLKISNITKAEPRSVKDIEEWMSELNVEVNIYNKETLLSYNTDEKFDMIIGNPPYVENKKIKDKEYKKRLYDTYKSAYKLFDLSILFIEKSLNLLKEDVGFLSFIITNKFLSADYGIKLRNILIENAQIMELINVSSLPIFKNRSTYPIIITLNKHKPQKAHIIFIKEYKDIKDLIAQENQSRVKIYQSNLKSLPKHVIPIRGNLELILRLFLKNKSMKDKFDDLNIVYRPYGFTNYSKFFDRRPKNANPKEDLPLLLGTGNVGKYHIKFNKRIRIAKRNLSVSHFIFPPEGSKKREITSKKLMIREIGKQLTCTYDFLGHFTNVTGLYFIILPSLSSKKLFGIMTILNSSLIDNIFKSLYESLHMKGNYLRFNGSFIETLPFPSNIPELLGNLGQILQFLTQLNYDRNQHEGYYENIGTRGVKKMLDFYTSFTESLIRFLYFSGIKTEITRKYPLMHNLLNNYDTFPFETFKYTYPYFNSATFQTFEPEKISLKCSKLSALMEGLNKNEGLIREVEEINKSFTIF